jgi:hypothetical protein
MGDDKYAVIMETDGEACESWLYFVKYTGNEAALEKLSDDINRIETPVMMDGTNLFDIDLTHLVSKQTATEMVMCELNSETYHRRFDGKMQLIDFGFSTKKRYRDERIVEKIDKVLGGGRIGDFVEGEYIPPEHLNPDHDSDVEVSDNSLLSDAPSDVPSSDSSDDESVDLDIDARMKI